MQSAIIQDGHQVERRPLIGFACRYKYTYLNFSSESSSSSMNS